jgi:phage terminase Nu1 subunit (DNA packaging protein)
MSAKKSPAKKVVVKVPIISPEQLDKINQANAANLIKKVKSGKTLNGEERRILEGMAGHDTETVTTSRLAEIFGINRKTLAQWRKEGKSVPDKVGGKEPLAEWRRWFDANPDAGHFDGKPSKSREELLAVKVAVEIDLLEIKRDKERGKLIPRHEVEELLVQIAMAMQSYLRRYEREIPALCLGLTLSQSTPLVKARTRELQDVLANTTTDFWNEHPENETA